jgi:hypothetical protein
MDRIKFLAVLRSVKSEASKWGYHGDVLADPDQVPRVGTLREQVIIATIWVDVRPRPVNEAERQLLARLVRAAVLVPPASQSIISCVTDNQQSTPDAIALAIRHAVANRRRRQRRGQR